MGPKAVVDRRPERHAALRLRQRASHGLDRRSCGYVHQIERAVAPRDRHPRADRRRRQPARQVTADVDFSQTEATSELFKPNQTPDPPPCAASSRSSRASAMPAAAPAACRGRSATSRRPPPPRRSTARAGTGCRRRRAAGATRRRKQLAARGAHQLRGRQDRARDAQRDRHDQAPEGGGGRQPARSRVDAQEPAGLDAAAASRRSRSITALVRDASATSRSAATRSRWSTRRSPRRAAGRRSSCRCGSSRRTSRSPRISAAVRLRGPGAADLPHADPAGAEGAPSRRPEPAGPTIDASVDEALELPNPRRDAGQRRADDARRPPGHGHDDRPAQRPAAGPRRSDRRGDRRARNWVNGEKAASA